MPTVRRHEMALQETTWNDMPVTQCLHCRAIPSGSVAMAPCVERIVESESPPGFTPAEDYAFEVSMAALRRAEQPKVVVMESLDEPEAKALSIDELIEASSLGTPGAKAVRRLAIRTTPPQLIAAIMARSMEPYVPGPDDDDDEMDDAYLADLDRRLNGLEGEVLSEEQCDVVWKAARRTWGLLQQVRKGTRVRCNFCGGHYTKGGSPCPMCDDGFMDRDEAIRYLEDEMDASCK